MREKETAERQKQAAQKKITDAKAKSAAFAKRFTDLDAKLTA